jgi:hypothetical protein
LKRSDPFDDGFDDLEDLLEYPGQHFADLLERVHHPAVHSISDLGEKVVDANGELDRPGCEFLPEIGEPVPGILY